MKKLYKFILVSYIGPFFMTFFIALFVLLMQFLWKYIDDLVGKGLEWHVIAQLLGYYSTTFVPMALPLAVLLSSLMTFGNLGERYELVAIKASGISLQKAMRPLIATSILLSIAAFYFSNNVMPVANLKAKSLLYDIRDAKPAVNIEPKVFYNNIDNFSIRVEDKDDDDKTIRGVTIYDHTSLKGNNNVTIAEWGTMETTPNKRYLVFKLYNGYNYSEPLDTREQRKDRPLQRIRFKEQERWLDLSKLAFNRTNEDVFKDHYSMLNLAQLNEAIDSLKQTLLSKQEEYLEFIDNSLRYVGFLDSNISDQNLKRIQKEKKAEVQRNPKSIDEVKEQGITKTGKVNQPKKEIPKIDPNIPDSANYNKENFLANFKSDARNYIIDRALNDARNVRNRFEWEKSDYNAKVVLLSKHKVELHRKFTLSFACIVLFFIGAPLGAIIRKGGLGFPLVFSVIFFIIFHILSITGEKLAKEGSVEPYQGMWLASAVLLPMGVFLTLKATSDSPLLDAESWKKFFKRITFRKLNG